MGYRRKSSFKKAFLKPDFIHSHAARWSLAWMSQDLNAELCARIILDVHQSLYPRQWSNGDTHTDCPFLEGSALATLSHFRIRSLPEAARQALLRWGSAKINLQVFDHLPSPYDVLKLQAQGVRCLTLLRSQKDLTCFEHEGRDFYSLLIHDLIHAQLMTQDTQAFERQCLFSAWLLQHWDHLSLNLPPMALAELEYLGSDMNSHVVHLIKTFQSWIHRHEVKSLHRKELDPLWAILTLNCEDQISTALTRLGAPPKEDLYDKRTFGF